MLEYKKIDENTLEETNTVQIRKEDIERDIQMFEQDIAEASKRVKVLKDILEKFK